MSRTKEQLSIQRSEESADTLSTTEEAGTTRRIEEAEELAKELGLGHLLETPQRKLARAAVGRGQVRIEDIQGLLAGRLVDAENQAASLSEITKGLIEMVFANDGEHEVSAEAALNMVERLARLQGRYQAELRKSADLLSRLLRPERPRLQVLAVGNEGVVVAERAQVGNNVILGEHDLREDE